MMRAFALSVMAKHHPRYALETDVHPGFMTDWQQPFVILLTQAEGMSVVHETIYEDRFGYTSTLESMGAHVGLYPKCLGEVPCRFREKQYMHSCVVRGPTPLKGTRLYIPDIRAGCSYILAALCAEGYVRDLWYRAYRAWLRTTRCEITEPWRSYGQGERGLAAHIPKGTGRT